MILKVVISLECNCINVNINTMFVYQYDIVDIVDLPVMTKQELSVRQYALLLAFLLRIWLQSQ